MSGPTDHLRQADVAAASNALTSAGLALFPCPEDWLFKARTTARRST